LCLVLFRIIGVTQDLTPAYTGSMYVYVRVSINILCVCVRRFLARDVIYTSRAYATMSVSVRLSVMEVHWRIIANLGFKF